MKPASLPLHRQLPGLLECISSVCALALPTILLCSAGQHLAKCGVTGGGLLFVPWDGLIHVLMHVGSMWLGAVAS